MVVLPRTSDYRSLSPCRYAVRRDIGRSVYDGNMGRPHQQNPLLLGASLFPGALDQAERDPYSGNVKPLTGQISRLLLELRIFPRYLQKQQGAILTIAYNAHLRPQAAAPGQHCK